MPPDGQFVYYTKLLFLLPIDALFRRPIVTADSATFAHNNTSPPGGGEPVTTEPEARRTSPLPPAAYGSTEMTLTTQLS